MTSEILKSRTKALARTIVDLIENLWAERKYQHLASQISRSSTSVASNYRAALRARSDREFYAKMCIVVEECDETLFWLEFIDSLGFLSADHSRLADCQASYLELLKIFVATKKSISRRISAG